LQVSEAPLREAAALPAPADDVLLPQEDSESKKRKRVKRMKEGFVETPDADDEEPETSRSKRLHRQLVFEHSIPARSILRCHKLAHYSWELILKGQVCKQTETRKKMGWGVAGGCRISGGGSW
jgi:hypothetical protein